MLIHEASPFELVDVLVEAHADTEADATWQRLLADLHPKQRQFVLDPATRKCALKGRRGGGSYAVAVWLGQDWHHWPGQMSLFIAQTKEHAKNILWPTLEALNDEYSLGITFNGLDLSARFPNGYTIQLKGAKDRAQIEKLRGFSKGCRRIGIDEAGSFGGHDKLFRYLIQSVLSPQLMDTRHRGGGQLALVGSPGLDCFGLYYERTTGKTHMGEPVVAWSTHHWTALDNPYVDARAFLLDELVDGQHVIGDADPAWIVDRLLQLTTSPQNDAAWDDVSPFLTTEFRREYLAHWVKDHSSLVYVPSEGNLVRGGLTLPPGTYRIVIGCDIGWDDGNGFCVAARRIDSPEVYVLVAYYVPELGTHEIAEELMRLKAHWRSGEIYVDTGGEGKRLLVDLEHYGVMAYAAGKGLKRPRIEYARALIESGSLQVDVNTCGDLLTEWAALPWSPDKRTHREGFVDDVTDAWLMAVNPLSQRFVAPAPPRPHPGEPGFRDYEAEQEHARSVRQGKRIRRQRRAA